MIQLRTFEALIPLTLCLLLVANVDSTDLISGRVIDAVTRKPLAGATVAIDGVVTVTDANGSFSSKEHGGMLTVRAMGYHRASRSLCCR